MQFASAQPCGTATTPGLISCVTFAFIFIEPRGVSRPMSSPWTIPYLPAVAGCISASASGLLALNAGTSRICASIYSICLTPVSRISGYTLTISGFATGLCCGSTCVGRPGIAELFHPRGVYLYFPACGAKTHLFLELVFLLAEIDTLRMIGQILDRDTTC